MTGEIYMRFKKYEDKFNMALHGNFVRFTTRELDEFNEVLKDHDGQGLTRSQRTCPHCLLNAIKKVAGEFEKYRNSPHGKKLEKEIASGTDGKTETGQTAQE